MAKRRRKVIPARKRDNRSGVEQPLLLRSAESLGRVIGTLQRQLDETTRRLSGTGWGAPQTKATKTTKKRATRRSGARKRTAGKKTARR